MRGHNPFATGPIRIIGLKGWQAALIAAGALAILAAVALVAAGAFIVLFPVVLTAALAYKLFGRKAPGSRSSSARSDRDVIDADYVIVSEKRIDQQRDERR